MALRACFLADCIHFTLYEAASFEFSAGRFPSCWSCPRDAFPPGALSLEGSHVPVVDVGAGQLRGELGRSGRVLREERRVRFRIIRESEQD